jgi:hypothetical protein
MSTSLTFRVAAALAIGAVSDVLLIRNGFSYSGPTLLDRYPQLWPIWLVAIVCGAFVLDYKRPKDAVLPGPNAAKGTGSSSPRSLTTPLAIVFGMLAVHAVLTVRDFISDRGSHNLLPFEYLFWTLAVAAPAYAGSLAARFASNWPGRTAP